MRTSPTNPSEPAVPTSILVGASTFTLILVAVIFVRVDGSQGSPLLDVVICFFLALVAGLAAHFISGGAVIRLRGMTFRNGYALFFLSLWVLFGFQIGGAKMSGVITSLFAHDQKVTGSSPEVPK